ncbi:MAG: MFS transporter [Candidatus Helarchaeota archaeon]
MNRSELIRLSIGQIGIILGYNILTMNLQDFLKNTAFDGSDLIAFSVITIAFATGAFTYLFSGWLSDKTYTRWGRRPYLLFSIPGAIALILMGLNYFPLPLGTAFIILSCLATIYAVTYRIMNTSYFALYQDLTEPGDRVKSTIVFNIFGLIGVAIAIVIPLAPDNPSANYIFITGICGIFYIASILFVYFLGPKEDLTRINKIEHPSVFNSIKETFKNRNFKNYAFSALFGSFTYSMVMFILKPFLDWKLDDRAIPIEIDFMVILGLLLPIAFVIFYFCNYASKKWGKKTFFKRSLIFGFLSFPFLLILTNQGSQLSLVIQLFILIVCVLFVVVVILSLQNAILMDITPTGKEATYTGVFFFITVVPFPFASQLAGVLLQTLNYDIGGFWLGKDFAYGVIMVILAVSIFISWLFLRRVKYKEELEQ